jgi:hypothetical protein
LSKTLVDLFFSNLTITGNILYDLAIVAILTLLVRIIAYAAVGEATQSSSPGKLGSILFGIFFLVIFFITANVVKFFVFVAGLFK